MAGKQWLVIIFLVLCAASEVAASIRGLDPALGDSYKVIDGIFKCLDGSRSIPSSQINDGYCDCVDGSDEPGTAACPNGKFYCANLGSEPVKLNSSFVDDDICDCCDGSDEPVGTCRNTCKDEGMAALAALEKELQEYDAGLQLRAEYVKTAASLRRIWKTKLEEAEKNEAPTKAATAAAEKERTILDEKVKKVEAKVKKLEEQLKPAAEISTQEETENKGEDDDQKAVDDSQSIHSAELNNKIENAGDDSYADEDGFEGDETSKESSTEETAEELAKRVASQWIPGASTKEDKEEKGPVTPSDDSPHSSHDELTEDEAAVDAGFAHSNPAADDDGDHVSPTDVGKNIDEQEDLDALHVDLGIVGSLKAWVLEIVGKVSGKPASATELQRLRTILDALKKKQEAAVLKASELTVKSQNLETEKKNLQELIDGSYGEDDVYGKLADVCVEANIDKYVYKICPFDEARQLENGSGPRLGVWDGFDESGEHMKFINGDSCWQGPNRSITVHVKCGTKEIITRVAEPSRCEYTAEMTTPAACSVEQVEKLRSLVAMKKSLLTQVRDEL